MTRFFILRADQFRVNDQCVNKASVQEFLRVLLRKFPPSHEFTIKQIRSSKSEKTERAMVFIAMQFQILKMVYKRKRKPNFYVFLPNALDLINDLLIKELSID